MILKGKTGPQNLKLFYLFVIDARRRVSLIFIKVLFVFVKQRFSTQKNINFSRQAFFIFFFPFRSSNWKV